MPTEVTSKHDNKNNKMIINNYDCFPLGYFNNTNIAIIALTIAIEMYNIILIETSLKSLLPNNINYLQFCSLAIN